LGSDTEDQEGRGLPLPFRERKGEGVERERGTRL
jgi:hypothetical protein